MLDCAFYCFWPPEILKLDWALICICCQCSKLKCCLSYEDGCLLVVASRNLVKIYQCVICAYCFHNHNDHHPDDLGTKHLWNVGKLRTQKTAILVLSSMITSNTTASMYFILSGAHFIVFYVLYQSQFMYDFLHHLTLLPSNLCFVSMLLLQINVALHVRGFYYIYSLWKIQGLQLCNSYHFYPESEVTGFSKCQKVFFQYIVSIVTRLWAGHPKLQWHRTEPPLLHIWSQLSTGTTLLLIYSMAL